MTGMDMKTHQINELIELLHLTWIKQPDLSLTQLLQKLAGEAGFKGDLVDISDDVLFYQLKMGGHSDSVQIPGLQKDYQEDFKTALLRARGVIKN